MISRPDTDHAARESLHRAVAHRYSATMGRYTTGALIAAALLTFTACGGGDATDEAVEAGIEEALGSNADVEIDGDGAVKIETDEGSYSAGGSAEIPDDFPSDVPLPDGSARLQATYADADGWMLTFGADDMTDEACVTYLDVFPDAGFTEESRFSSPGTSTGIFTNDQHEVTVSCGEAAMGIVLTVSPTSG